MVSIIKKKKKEKETYSVEGQMVVCCSCLRYLLVGGFLVSLLCLSHSISDRSLRGVYTSFVLVFFCFHF